MLIHNYILPQRAHNRFIITPFSGYTGAFPTRVLCQPELHIQTLSCNALLGAEGEYSSAQHYMLSLLSPAVTL